MGWFSDLLFGGTPATSAKETVLPKRVEAWENSESNDSSPQAQVSGGNAKPMSDADSSAERTPVSDPAANPYRTDSGSKIIPNVEIERIEPHVSSDMKHIEVWAHVKNHSTFEIEVRRINFLRQHTEPGRFLKPGESHELKIYTGDTPRNNAEHKAEMQFKIVGNDDYFQADHRIDYHYERDEHGEFYVPEELKLILPIRDI